MDNKPSLSQYFGETEVPPASQFFDEIGTSPSDMIQSVYLGESEVAQTTSANLFPTSMTASFTQQKVTEDMKFASVVPTVSGAAALPATSLPDPSTFFDTIGPDPQMSVSGIATPNILTEAMDGLGIKDQPVDKEADRRRDAWIPSEEAKKVLLKAQSSPKGAFFPEREVLTIPTIIFEEELPDALHEVAVKYLGVSQAGRSGVARASHVARDAAGLRELLRCGCLRAAVNLTTGLLGGGRGGRGAGGRVTPRALQLWLARLLALVRVRRAGDAAGEGAALRDCAQPDMYYQFYPEQYGDRSGSLAPFALRLLLAELPAHAGQPGRALDKLYAVLSVVQQVVEPCARSARIATTILLANPAVKQQCLDCCVSARRVRQPVKLLALEMLANLHEGKTEDGTGVLTSEQDKAESIRLWSGRETRVQHSIVNCAIALKDYRLASRIMAGLQERATSPGQQRALASARGRLWLLAGHWRAAAAQQDAAAALRQLSCPTADVREFVDLGLLDVAHGKYQDAYNKFARAADQEPTNIMVANNLSVCLLYMGRLKEAIAVLQKAINSDPERGLNEHLLINLCTLYELESSKNMDKKLNLLRMMCKYKSDTIPNVMECLKLS